jgi:hypothetical protein
MHCCMIGNETELATAIRTKFANFIVHGAFTYVESFKFKILHSELFLLVNVH